MGRVFALSAILLVTVVGCHTITEELPPAQNVSGPNPVIVNPPPGNSVLIIPSPAPPTTQPATPPAGSNPTPKPSTTPSAPPAQNNAPPESVFVSVTSFLRNGQLIKGRAPTYQPGDVIYLTCTPKDGGNNPTKNHGPIQGWNIRSGNLGGNDWYFTDADTFNPDIHVSPNSSNGSIDADCRVDDIKSNTLTIPIQG